MHSDIEQRARFEAWARQEPRYFNIARSGENYFYPTVQDAWEVWQAALASQAQVPDGYVLVPREPTDDMLEKANDEKVGGHCYYCSQEYASYGDASRVWAAMIAAAPAPEVSG